MPRIAQLSDLHFGEVPGIPLAELAADVVAAGVDAIAVSGDLTRRAEPEEFAQAFAFLATLGPPLIVVPGNHDIPRYALWQRFTAPRARFRAASPVVAAAELRLPGLRLLALDTTSRAQWHLDWSAGGIPEERCAELAARLAAAAGDGARVIAVCHHPLRHGTWAIDRSPPRGAEAAVAMLRAHKVAAVLCGHLHRAEVTQLGPDGPLQVIGPSALSGRGPGIANGWTLIGVPPEGPLEIAVREWTDGEWTTRPLVVEPAMAVA